MLTLQNSLRSKLIENKAFIQSLRDQLFDLSMRNPLINCKLDKLINPIDLDDTNWSKVYTESIAFKREFGISNTLSVSHFLEWFHPGKSEFIISPLLVVPAEIIKRRKIRTLWEFSEDESESFLNPTLLRALEDHYDLDSTSIETSSENWHEHFCEKLASADQPLKITHQLTKKNEWQIIKVARLGNFNYKKSTLVYDYDSIIKDPNLSISELLNGSLINETAEPVSACLPLDETQLEAVSYALSNSASIQGPPGTGKSHTIVQLIYEYLRRDKKVLFVSEKSAALDVVYKQFQKDKTTALTAFFNGQTDEKKSFYKLLKKSWEEFHEAASLPVSEWSNQQLDVLDYYLKDYSKGDYSTKFLVDRLIAKSNYPTQISAIPNAPKIDDWIQSYDHLEQVEEELGSQISASFLCRLNKRVFLEKDPIEVIHKRIRESIQILERIKIIGDRHKLNNSLKDTKRLSIAASILTLVNKTQLDLLNIEHKSYKTFGNLAKKYELTKSKLKRQLQLTSKWKNKPNKSDITELLDLLKHHHAPKGIMGLLRRRSPLLQDAFEGFERDLSTTGKIQLLEELRQEWNLIGQLEEIEIKLKHQFGIHDPENEVAFILNLRTKLNEIATSDYLILLEHEQSIAVISDFSKLNLDVQRLTHLLKFTFKGDLPDEFAGLLHFFHQALSELPRLEKLGVSLDKFYQLPAQIQDYVTNHSASVEELDGMICAHHLQLKNKYSQAFKSLSGTSLQKDLNQFQRMVNNTSRSRLDAMKIRISSKILDIEKLLNTPASKLKGSDKTLKKLIKGQKRLLIHEMNKKQSHLSVKKLEQDCRDLLSFFQPVWMMNPLAVSQYLENKKDLFDVVIFDESSQIPIEDALPSIYRSKQVIVVGDEQQMPPSSYFSASKNDLTLLTQANLSYKKFMLKWHYRSRHPQLIEFSNRYFYESELKTFPPTVIDSPIDFIHHDGNYNSGSNQQEAALIVQELSKETDLSKCAVIAFSKEQEKTIRKSLNTVQLNAEDILISNLENVQGIERDNVYISVGYGYNEEGVFRKQFGPLNQDFGLNRLNVMVSRAKKKLKVFSSVKSEDFDLSENSGVQSLSDFLEFAEKQSAHERIEFTEKNSLPVDIEKYRLRLYKAENSSLIEAYIQHETGKVLLIEPGLDPAYDLTNTYITLKSRFDKIRILLHYDFLVNPKRFQTEIDRFFG